MTARPVLVSALDLELLRAIEREGSVAAACRRLRIPRDRGVYRIARLGRRFPGGAVTSVRGGRGQGSSRLTPAARKLLGAGPEALGGTPGDPPTVLVGRYHRLPDPHVVVGGVPVHVEFIADEGERVGVAVEPDSIVLAPARFPSSARNVWGGTVRGVRPAARGGGPFRRLVRVGALGTVLEVALTPASVASLGLRPGRPVYLYVKATALRRAPPTRGSPRS